MEAKHRTRLTLRSAKTLAAAVGLLFVLGACSALSELTQQEEAAVVVPAEQSYSAFFGFDSADIDSRARTAIAAALDTAAAYGPVEIRLSGHADRAGPAAYNMTLAKRRVDAVSEALVAAGIAPEVISAAVLGEADPDTPTQDGQAEASNRRVDIDVIGLAALPEPEEPLLPEEPSAPASAAGQAPEALAAPVARTVPDGDCTIVSVLLAGARVNRCVQPAFNP